ncbi:AGE family epimerase/isomerase [Niallia sp. Marseille-Q9988]
MNSEIRVRDPAWLTNHIFGTLQFYYPRCIDYRNGGYFQCYLDDGTICNNQTKHLVGTSRFIYVFSVGAMLRGDSWCLQAAEHGLSYLQNYHLDINNGGYFWKLNDNQVSVSKKYAYGHAFALLAASKAYQAGIPCASHLIDYIYNILDQYFWEPDHGLYLNEMNSDWSIINPYRGQNPNMHLCEAMISAYEATGNHKYLERAYILAYNVTLNLAQQSEGLIWEHYDPNWVIDWNYIETNKEMQQFRPQGFIPGHSIEWSKLLLLLERYKSESWMIERAVELYNSALKPGLDTEYGGIYYSIDREGKVLESDKYYWVMAEAIGASALLGTRLKAFTYWRNYDALFNYAWNYFIDKKRGGWYEKVNRFNQKVGNKKSPVTKTDYHPIANCYETIRALTNL